MKKSIHELYWIRALACLSVVLIHALSRTLNTYHPPHVTYQFVQSFKLLFMFATPTFIFISEVILSHVYPEKLPQGFFKKRFKYIVLPYMLIPIFYGLYKFFFEGFTLQKVALLYKVYVFQASWHGYFIVIILQFYLLHVFYIKFLKKTPVGIVLLGSFIISSIYLYVYNFVDPFDFPKWVWPFYKYAKLPFIGWLFFFSIAYYVGKNLESIRNKLKAWSPIILLGLLISLFTILFLYYTEKLTIVSSLRIDVMVYTTLLFFMLLYVFMDLKKVPTLVLVICKYSFSIYLLHPLMFDLINLLLPTVPIILYPIILYIGAIAFSIAMAKLIGKLPFGECIVGKLRPLPK